MAFRDISRLRYWVAAAAILTMLVVVAFYLYTRIHASPAIQLPKNIPGGVQRSTQSFSLSKSEGGHTLFTVRAERATEFKEGGRAELKDVKIVIYGHQADRFDQIYGSDFQYDPASGNVIAKGTVHIDLQGATSAALADQAPPLELKNPVHLVTSGLVFNQKTGDANTAEKVEFRLPQASGWAIGAHYHAQRNQLDLDRDVHIDIAGKDAASITASHGYLTKEPRTAVLYNAHVVRENSLVDTAQLTLFLRPDDSIDRIGAGGGVDLSATGATALRVHAPEGVFYLEGRSNELHRGELRGGVNFESEGAGTLQGRADTVDLDFAARNRLDRVHAAGHVKMTQVPKSQEKAPDAAASLPAAAIISAPRQASYTAPPPAPPLRSQTFELDADIVDMWLDSGNQIRRAETSEHAQLTFSPQKPTHPGTRQSGGSPGRRDPTGPDAESERTVVTAAKFYADFKENRISSLLGTPQARVVSYAPGEPERVSTSRRIEATFLPSGEIAQVTQRQDVHYLEHLPNGADRAAWAQEAVYVPASETLTLNGGPRVVDGGMTTTARVLRFDQKTGDATAEGNVKTTYSELKPRPGGAFMATGDPIHVTARRMTARRSTGVVQYAGEARLWQGANVISAPFIDFNRDQRTIAAYGRTDEAEGAVSGRDARLGRVATVLTQQDRTGKLSPVNVTSSRLTYTDGLRVAAFEGGVVARSAEGMVSANHVDVYFQPRSASGRTTSGPASQTGQLDRLIASGNVVLQQPGRRGTGERLVYTAEKDEYLLSGGRPSIFDAEHGSVTGDSLTFYSRDDKLLVEGGEHSRSITHTRAPK